MQLRTTYATWQEAVRAIVTQLLTMFDRGRGWAGIQSFNGGLSVGGGSTVTRIITGAASLDFPSISSNGTEERTITVTGALTGDTVFLSAPSAIDTGLIWCGVVTATNTVTVRLHNTTGGSINPADATWRATVISYA